DLLFGGGGADDLNVDNVDRPFGLPGVDVSIFSGSFFALASPRRHERSPSSVHRAGFSDEGDPDDDFPIGLASKSFDAASGRAPEPVVPIEGRAADAIIPDSDEGSSDNTSVGPSRREGSGGSSSCPTPPLNINVEFVKPFQGLLGAVFKALRCEVGGPSCFDVVTDEIPLLCPSHRNIFMLPKLDSSVWKEDERQHHLSLEAENQLIEECDAKITILNAAKARVAEIDVELPSHKKAVEERGAILFRNSAHLQEAEHDLVLTLSDLKRIREAEIAPLGLTSISNALETFRVVSRDGVWLGGAKPYLGRLKYIHIVFQRL
ncbi:hypothetical protein ACLOJK_024166, partial [Asimina triloba]